MHYEQNVNVLKRQSAFHDLLTSVMFVITINVLVSLLHNSRIGRIHVRLFVVDRLLVVCSSIKRS